MRKNEGAADRSIRVVVGLGLLAAAWMFMDLGEGAILGIVAGVVGLVLVTTGLVGFCPAYMLCGLKTCSVKPDATE